MKRSFLIAAVSAAAVGTALHFLYAALPNPLTALFSPVNESVWEHLKLLYWPTLLGAWALSAQTQEPYRLWSAFFAAVLAMPAALLGAYFAARKLLGELPDWTNIALYYLVLFGGFALAWRLYRSGRAKKAVGYLLSAVMLYGAALILFTFAAPPVGIFLPPA